MGLYLRGKIYWFRIRTSEGRIQRSTGTANKRLAENIYSKAKTDIIEGRWFKEQETKDDPPFLELAEEYENWMQGRYRSKFKIYIISQLKERFRDYSLSMIGVRELEKLQSEKLKRGKQQKIVEGKLHNIPNKPATINRFIAVIAHMFTKAADWKMIDRANIPKVKMLKENNKRLRYLSKEECSELIAACDPHLRPIVITALNTGMRRQEILGLRWDAHVDLKHGFILLSHTKNGERREIPINSTLRATLQSLPRRLDVQHVFFDPASGKPYQEVKKSFATALRRAKIQDFHFHDLRHTFASHLVMAGIDLVTVKELLGHADVKMTLRYAHLAPSHKVKAVEIYDRSMSGYNLATVPGEEKVASV
ncbi:MAG: site-specific integrase [Nitrospiraceae bacterium]|nr:site-specific integrase [Nitrospiraceae bacterium]